MKQFLIAAGLMLAAIFAHADGVPLITAGPAFKANAAVFQRVETKTPQFVKLHSVAVNKTAFGANVLTVEIDGKLHRFAGRMMPRRAPLTASQAAFGPQPDYASWSGTEGTIGGPDGGMLTLSKDMATGAISGSVWLAPGRAFQFNSGSGVMVETNPDRAPRPKSVPPMLPDYPIPQGARK